MSMAWEVKGSSWRAISLGRAGGEAPGRFHFTIIGLLLVGAAGLLCAPAASPAALQKEKARDSQADAKGGDDQQASKAEETLIYPNDLLFIQVFDVEQMSREYRVSATGTVDFPLLPQPVRVAGLTPARSGEVISQKCIEAGVLSHPQISVTVRESRIHSVVIGGAVKSPQIYPVFGRISLMDILSQAGGLVDDAGSSVTIMRGEVSRRVLASEGGGSLEAGKSASVPSTVTIDLRRLLEGGDPSLNVDVYPGDRVTVQRAGVVFVLGAVNKAGGFLLTEERQNMTVLRALALAEDLKSTAKPKKAMIIRPDPSAPGGREEIPVNLRAMLQGHAPDRPLQDNDILFVPDSTAVKALHRAGEVAVSAAGYAAIYRW
jgi:polysaccharide export outer membrane protein